MLSRAALRLARPAAVSRWAASSARPRALPTIAGAPTVWSRGMAKGNRPPYKPNTSNAPRPLKPQQQQQPTKPPAPQTPESSKPSESAEAAKPQAPPSGSAEAAKSQEQKPANTTPEQSPDKTESQIPLSELPDLTQGIPSTLEYEMAGATDKAALEPVNEQGTSGAGGRGKGELPASAYVSSTDRRRQKYANYMFGASLVGMVGGIVYLGRNWEEEDMRRHPDVPNGWGLGLWWNRASTRIREVLTYYHEPSFEKLLPDPDPIIERPYTLVLSLEDLLVHSEWSREHGWRLAKRPGVDYFLRYLSQYYELVLWTSVPFAIAEPIIRKLDPFHIIVWPLFREATKYKDGEVIKDLSYLNRDLSKVIIIDTDAQHVRNQPENAIVLPKWTGDPKDKELVALVPFLEYINVMQYSDVRKVLRSFEGKHIPSEFARREAIARAEFNKRLEAEGKKHPHKGKSGVAALGSMFGLKPQNMSVLVAPEGEINPADAFAQGKMLQDIARERGQRNYEELEKMIREHGEKWLKDEAAQQEAMQKEAMNNMMSSFSGWFVPSSAKKEDKAESEKKA